MNNTSISWTEKTWNPVTGCTPISEGCAHCYAKRMAQRLRGRYGYPEDEPFRVTLHPDRLMEPLRMRKPARIFVCSMGDLFHEDVPDRCIDQVFAVMALAPWHTFIVLTKRPERMRAYVARAVGRVWGLAGDMMLHGFHGSPLPAYEWKGGEVAMKCDDDWPLPNVWLGVTTENQARADERIPILLQVPAAVRYVSVEPMLGPVDLKPYLIPLSKRVCAKCWQYREADHQERPGLCARMSGYTVRDPSAAACAVFEDRRAADFAAAREWLGRVDWVIAGGETGPGARPMHPDWVRSLRDQCQVGPTPFHFKSWGAWGPHRGWTIAHRRDAGQLVKMTTGKGNVVYQAEPADAADDAREVEMMRRVGAKRSGRLLDGRVWDEWPEVGR